MLKHLLVANRGEIALRWRCSATRHGRAHAAEHGVPVLPGTSVGDLAALVAFFEAQRERDPGAAVLLKAVAGGGGRGMRGVNMATTLEIDAVIDPASTRAWLLRRLDSTPARPRATARRFVDGW